MSIAVITLPVVIYGSLAGWTLLLLGPVDPQALLVSLLHVEGWDLVVGGLLLGRGLGPDSIDKPLGQVDLDWLRGRWVCLVPTCRLVQLLLQLVDPLRAAVIFLAVLLYKHIKLATLLDISSGCLVLVVVALALALSVAWLPPAAWLGLDLIHVVLVCSGFSFPLVLLIE